MQYFLSKNFKKSFLRMSKKIQYKTSEQLNLFTKNHLDKQLNNHGLSGVYTGYRSININGDIRAIYEITNDGFALFVDLGSHSKLYK